MAVRIAEATSDENGRARDGVAGDQKQRKGKGEEVGVKNWYDRTGGWSVYLECTDIALAAAAAENATRIANDDSFGYDQDQRSTAYKAILAAGSIEAAADSELDCSVLVFTAYKIAGLKIEVGYTGNLESRFMATGKFIAHREPKYLTSGDYARTGGIYLTAGKHTMIVVSDGSKSASPSTPIKEDYSSEADQIDPPYVLSLGRVNVRATAGISGKIIYTASKNEKLPFGEYDWDTGWYAVETPKGNGFITNKPKYTKLVTE